MSREYNLTEGDHEIRGRFWLPDQEDRKLNGLLKLKAGSCAALETEQFLDGGDQPPFPYMFAGSAGKNPHDAWFAAAQKVILGHDDHGHPLTLVQCSSSFTHRTLAMRGHKYRCEGAIFGGHFGRDDLLFDGIRLRFDHQDEWLGKPAYDNPKEEYRSNDVNKQLIRIAVPIRDQRCIPLGLTGYKNSEFYSGLSMQNSKERLVITSQSFLDLEFEQPMSWQDVLEELHDWAWFLSLATRTTVDIQSLSVLRKDVRVPIDTSPMQPLPVWLPRSRSREILHPKRTRHDFHFTYGEIERQFADVMRKWKAMRETWAAVLHRFFAVTDNRRLYINEEFLFLAQAIESLHRSRKKQAGEVPMRQAAKEAYLKSPEALRQLLGKRGIFVNQLAESRNYWTHYGRPGPSENPEILDGDELIDLNEKLRRVIEAAILGELGIPDSCIARVWSPRWDSQVITFH